MPRPHLSGRSWNSASENTLTADRAAQTLDYWRTTAQQLLSDPEASGSPEALKSYSKLAVGQGNLLADRGYSAEAEQAYQIACNICPSNVEAVGGLSELLRRGGRTDEARRLLDEFARKYPDQRSAMERLRGK